MRPRRYFQVVEKREDEVNIIWMILHLVIFLITAVVSVVAANAIGDIYDTFNYRCILYAKPRFLIDISHKEHKRTPQPDVPNNLTKPENISEELGDSSTFEQPVSGTENFYIINDEIHFKNSSVTGTVTLIMGNSIFSSTMRCDIVMFMSMVSLIVSSAFFVLIFLCGKGGRKHSSEVVTASWLYVFPVFFTSVFMSVFAVISASTIDGGLEEFCSHFEEYTAQKGCSHLMDYFTKQQMAGRKFFWRSIKQAHTSFTIIAIAWLVQTLVTVLRMLRSADFGLNVALISTRDESDEEEDKDEDEDPFWDRKKFNLYQTVLQFRHLRGVKSEPIMI